MTNVHSVEVSAREGNRNQQQDFLENLVLEPNEAETVLTADSLAQARENLEIIRKRRRAKDGFIEGKTRNQYNGMNKRLLLWLYEQREIIPPIGEGEEQREAYGKFIIQEAMDILDGCVSESTRAKKAMDLIKRTSSRFCAIDLKKILQDSDLFLDFLLSRRGRNDATFLSATGYGNYRSALTYLFTMGGITKTEEFDGHVSRGMKGLTKEKAKENQATGARLTEGKDALSFEGYKFLAEKMIEEEGSEGVFGHCFLVLTWNLMCRSNNTTHIRMEHISYEGDCIGIQFAHIKTDQSGDGAYYKRHLFGNAEDPTICPLYALGRYLISNNTKTCGNLFPTASYDRFREILVKLCEKYKSELAAIGIDHKYIGVHSIRKGSATYACNGTTCAPSIAAICNRAGWSMGKVQNIYIKYEAAQDQYVGRILSGTDPNSADLAQTPPFFRIATTSSELEVDVPTCTESDINTVAKEAFPKLYIANGIPTRVPLTKMLLAALLHSQQFSKERTPAESPFRGSYIFLVGARQNIANLEKCVCVSFPWKPEFKTFWTAGRLSGIPPHVKILTELAQILETQDKATSQILQKIQEERDAIVQALTNELDKRNIQGGELTLEVIKDLLISPIQEKLQDISTAMNVLTSTSQQNFVREGMEECDETEGIDGDQPFKWDDGKYHLLPSDYIIPTKRSPLQMWYSWHMKHDFGQYSGLVPLSTVSSNDIQKKQSRKYSRLVVLCSELDTIARAKGYLNFPLTIEQMNTIYDSQEVNFILPTDTTKTGRKRDRMKSHGEILWGTVVRYYEERNPVGRGKKRKKN